jgi:Zn-dependent membrane protease YugP
MALIKNFLQPQVSKRPKKNSYKVWLLICYTVYIIKIFNQKMTQEIFLVSMLFVGLSMIVSLVLKNKFTAYSKVGLSNGMTGREIAEKMLRENGIYDVKVVSVDGFLSDHYNPLNKTVNLSPEVYQGNSIAAAAVAAHECGHAVQHATAYTWLNLRSRLVPFVQFSSNIVQWILFTLTALFSVITLPVEFDASRRALVWLEKTNVTNRQEYPKAKNALKWAATTYVVAALAAVVTLVQYILIYANRQRS